MESWEDADWVVDELVHAGPEHLDPEFVAGFDAKQGHPDPGPDVAALRARGLDRSARVVDLGAGTGRFALAAAREFGEVTAVDVSPAMVDRLRAAATAAGLSNLTCVRAGFLSHRHTGRPLDAVYTRHALHQLPDFWKAMALHRIAAMLRPGGVLRLRDLIFDFRPAEAPEVLRAWMAGAAADGSRGYTRQDYAEHLRTEFSTFRWLLEPMLEAAGFEIADASWQGRIYGTYTCVRR
ncbi:class I SAM-dependent methyltransferase [Streptomyces aidingensis]|nr:class I SAM-dependent methyltransferase [Streptomyces aidingensis]